jgi:formate dehydrogenase iron-sulfur subunit
MTWQFSSDVCKHCENAGCLEACPTGSIIRTEFGGVFIQPDICNGCGYCVVACPFGVVDRRPTDGRAFKCTFCYDRQKAGLQPACAKACPTGSILFGDLHELQRVADARIAQLHSAGMTDAKIYDAADSSVGGTHAFFLIRGDEKAYNLPKSPEVPTVHLRAGWTAAATAAGAIALASILAFAIGARR